MGYNKENYARIRAAYQTKYLKAYEEAVRERYRFFSFGDAMFIR